MSTNLNDYSPRNPIWATRDHKLINLDLTHPEFGEITYSASNEDVVELSVALFNAAVNGDFGPISDFPINIDADRTVVINNVIAYRDSLKLKGYPVELEENNIKWFYSTPESKLNYISLIATAVEKSIPNDYSFMDNWRLMDGSTVNMTLETLKKVRDAGIIQEMMIDSSAQTHIANIKISDDPFSYDFSTGWPETYTG